jgi:hypothetical protein
MRTVLLAVGLSVTVALAGCGGDDGDDTTPRTSRSSTTSSTTGPTTTTTAPCAFAGTTTPQQNPLASETQYLTDVTAVRDGCTDTITFTFRPSAAVAPSYQVAYEPGPFYNSAGEVVQVAGTAFLKIRFEPAWIADLSQESAPLTYTGPRVITPVGLNTVHGLALFDASEGVVAWVAGVDGQRPFRVEPSAGQVVVTLGP